MTPTQLAASVWLRQRLHIPGNGISPGLLGQTMFACGIDPVNRCEMGNPNIISDGSQSKFGGVKGIRGTGSLRPAVPKHSTSQERNSALELLSFKKPGNCTWQRKSVPVATIDYRSQRFFCTRSELRRSHTVAQQFLDLAA